MEDDRDIFVISINGNNRYFRILKRMNYKVVAAREVDGGESSEQSEHAAVVVKKLEYELPTNGDKRLEAIAMMKESWRRVCRLNHPNVLPCIHAILDKHTFTERFLTGTQIMDYSPIGDLHQYMRENPILPEEQIKHFSYQLLSGIDYMHSLFSMIHGDIKPQNIIVFPDAAMPYEVRLKVIDLDHHAALASSVTQTKDGKKVMGTRRYMSPEMILEQRVGRRTDIWSFGCVVLEMLCGTQPFAFAFHESGFSDPFDPLLKSTPFQTISEMDYRYGGGFAVPCIPSSVTDPDCQHFLKDCLTVNVRDRATAATLLSHAWLVGEIPKEEIARSSIISLQHPQTWLDEICNYSGPERQWTLGIHCANLLLTHFLTHYDRHTFDRMSQSLLEQLRTQPYSIDQLRMCVEHLETKIPTLPGAEQGAVQIAKVVLESNPSACEIVRHFFPVVLSMKTLADLMNNYCRSINFQHNFTVQTSLVWEDIKHELDKRNPIICQIGTNETDQQDDVLKQAKMVWLAHICPLQILELEFVIVHGYKETKKGETLVCITKAGGDKIIKALSDFEAAWNWNASDSLMQKYLMLDETFPASALFLS